jgi:hypothetical protein
MKRPLEDWFKERVAKEQKVKEAREALAKLNQEKANPLIAEVETLDASIKAMRAIAKDKAAGKEIPELGQ